MRSLFLFLPLLSVFAGAQPTTPNPGLRYYYPVSVANPRLEVDTDICVYGGTPAGVAAAVQASRMGKKTALFVFRRHVGGMTSGGLTASDLGTRQAIGGLANEFYARLGKTKDFKPSEAETMFLTLLREAGGGWPHELYVREGRRMISDYVMSQDDCMSRRAAEDSIGLGFYNMDSHHVRRIVVDGAVRNEGDVQVRVPRPYPVSYRSIVPREGECANLLVPVCLSASHIAYGSIRMEPVFMILGQSAGTAASMAIDSGVAVQQVDYAKLKSRLLADKQILRWE